MTKEKGSQAAASSLQQSYVSIRIDRGAILKENKRKNEEDTKNETERKAKLIKYDKEKRAIKRCLDCLTEDSESLEKKKISASSSSSASSITPATYTDFDIPNSWKIKEKKVIEKVITEKIVKKPTIRNDLNFTKYRTIVRNSYKHPLQKGTWGVDDVPQCICTSIDGCGVSCQNRLLFM